MNCNIDKVRPLIDKLATDKDLLWPNERWPAIYFDSPLQIGAKGGHGSIGYEIVDYIPGHFIQFRFLKPKGFIGTHEFKLVELSSESVKMSHQINMQLEGLCRITWPTVIRWLHDALVEDAFNKAETYVYGQTVQKRKWPVHVRLLRRLAKIQKANSK